MCLVAEGEKSFGERACDKDSGLHQCKISKIKTYGEVSFPFLTGNETGVADGGLMSFHGHRLVFLKKVMSQIVSFFAWTGERAFFS